MMGRQRAGLSLILVGSIVFVLFGVALSRAKPLGGLDFRELYEGTGCLLHDCDPYNAFDVRAYYFATGDAHAYPEWALYTLALLNYLPTIYPFTAPFALLSWRVAQPLWTGLIAVSFLLAAYAIWKDSKYDAPLLAGCLISFLLANSEITLSGGNAAGFVVSLCVLGVWCFLHKKFAVPGVLCFATSLAMKPHDAGLIWLYFLLVGGTYRKRAWQILAVTVVLGIVAIAWVSRAAPHWLTEMRATMEVYSAPGGANYPGIAGNPKSSFRSFSLAVYPGMVCDLQSIVAVFLGDPRLYNFLTYLFCAPFLLIWIGVTMRSRFSPANAYLALATIIPFTLLLTYHRTTDAKLLLLAVPACALLWCKGGVVRWVALAVTGGGILITGDIPLVIFGILVGKPDWTTVGPLRRIALMATTRPIPLVLLAMGIFYLWAYVRSTWASREVSELAESGSGEPASGGRSAPNSPGI